MNSTHQIQTIKLIKKFVLSLFVLNLFLLSGIFESYLGIPKILKYLFSIYTLYYILKLYNASKTLKINNLKDLFFKNLFIIVSIYLLISSFRFETFYLQEIFGERFFFLPYLLPIIFLSIKYELIFFKILLKFSYILLFFGIVVEVIILFLYRDVSFYVRGIHSMLTFSIATFLLVLVSHLFTNRLVGRIAFFYLFIFAIITANWGRRGETIESLFFIISAFLIKATSRGIGSGNKILLIFFGLTFAILTYFIIIENKDNLYIFERGINQESFEKSRGETIRNFFYQFGANPYDWFIGRGLNGEFQKFNIGEDRMSRSIEIGYFNILLKGGLLYLIPMMYLFFRAFYLGFFQSNNDLAKGLAIIVLWQMIYMLSFGMANYSPYYLIVWIAVGACFDPSIRKPSNKDLKLFFNNL